MRQWWRIGRGAGAPVVPVDPPDGPPAIQLAGDPATFILPQLPNISPARAALEDIDGGLLLSRMTLVLTREATVADFNAAAKKIGATAIAFSRTNSPFLTLALPRQSNGAAVKQLAVLLRDHPGLLLAVPGRQPEVKELPSENGVTAVAEPLDHLWPAGFPAAWNVRALAQADCGSRKVTVVVPDLYTAAPPDEFRNQVPGAAERFETLPQQPRNPAAVNNHGYEVAAVLAGKFDGTAPTGANPFPDCLKLVPVDLSGLDFFQAVEVIRAAIDREEGKVIVSASIGYPIALCGSNGDGPCPDVAIRNALPLDLQEQMAFRVAAGIAWAEFAVQPAVVDEALLAVAAGNERNNGTSGKLGQVYAGFRDARLASPFAIATQLPSLPAMLADDRLWTTLDSGYPRLTLDTERIDHVLRTFGVEGIPPVPDRNVTLVGSTTQATVFSDVQLQRSAFSNDEADLYAVGEGVTGLGSPPLNGTSFSTAQVAGLASYLWLLDDDLRSRPVEETLRLIRGTSRKNVELDDNRTDEGFIDAYAAVLALDALHQTDQIRKTLLNVNNDGLFNHLDLQEFAENYQIGIPNPPSIPAARDYSRFDLNSDGFTGGILTERFDLDADGLEPNGAPRFTTVTATIGGVEVPLNEEALTDAQILCYYAYGVDSTGTPFYDASGDTGDVRGTLLSRCLGLQMDVALPNGFSTSATLSVTLRQPNGTGGFGPASGLLVELTLPLTEVCTTAAASPASGRTNGSGLFTATVGFGSDCTDLSVVVTVRADEGGPPLAQRTVRASARGLGVRLNRIATAKGEVTNAGGILVQDQRTSVYPPQQGRDYTPPDVALNGSGAFPAPPEPPASTYTYTADYSEAVSPSEVETDTVTGGTLRLTASCTAEGSARINVVTTGIVDPFLQFPAGRFRLTVDGTLTGTVRNADFEAKFTLRRSISTVQSVTLTSLDQIPSRTFTNSIDVVGPVSYDLGMTAKTICVSGSPERSAGSEVELTFSITPIE